jgi:arabinose-5-phosphate isomerase
MKTTQIISTAIRTIRLQAESVAALEGFIDAAFEQAVMAIAKAKGRLVVSGIGKSAIIAQKIVATLNSTGTPAVFLHAADAIHGDLGMVQEQDVVLIISKSGESPEIKVLAPLVKNFGNTIIGMVGNMDSYLATHSDIILNTTVAQEACPNNLAPTTSTTAQMVMGDALAVCLMEVKQFSTEDFAKFHPGGMLGKQLYLRVKDLYVNNEKPMVSPGSSLREVIVEMTRRRLGATAVVDKEGKVRGIITDGDLRRMLEKGGEINGVIAAEIMSEQPKTIEPDALAVDALELLRHNNISQVLVTENDQYLGMIHLHDLLREGLI